MYLKNLLRAGLVGIAIFLTIFVFSSDKKAQAKALNRVYDDKDCKLSKISIIDLKKEIKEKKVTIVDVNGTISYANGHLADALDIDAKGFEGQLPIFKDSLIVIYAKGEQCSEDKDACKKCSESLDLRDKCFAYKEACEKCRFDKEIREKCNASKDSLASATSTKNAAVKLKELGYKNIKCLCAGLKGWIEAGGVLEKERFNLK